MTAQDGAPLWDTLLTVGRPPRGRRASHAIPRPKATSRGMGQALVITAALGLTLAVATLAVTIIIGGMP